MVSGAARAHHSAVTLGDRVCIFGGSTVQVTRTLQPSGDTSASMLVPKEHYLYVVDTTMQSSWHIQPETAGESRLWPAPRKGAVMVAWLNRYLVVFGGQVRTFL